MKSLLYLFISAMIAVQQPAAADFWKYPKAGPGSEGEHFVGKAGQFRSYQVVTNERPEKVVLWYAKQLQLTPDHSLVKLATAGFRELKTPHHASYNIVKDGDAEQWGALITASFTADFAHVHIFVRPGNDSADDLSISIAQCPSGTAVSVVQSISSATTTKKTSAK